MTRLPAGDFGSVLIRVDYSDEAAWRDALGAATAPQLQPWGEVFQANLVPFEDVELSGVDPQTLATLPVDGYLSYAFVADARTMRDQTFVVLDLGDERGRWFRCESHAVQSIENNLAIANMDFFEFADNVDEDGVFRDFR